MSYHSSPYEPGDAVIAGGKPGTVVRHLPDIDRYLVRFAHPARNLPDGHVQHWDADQVSLDEQLPLDIPDARPDGKAMLADDMPGAY